MQHAFRSEVGQDYGHPSEHWFENAYHEKIVAGSLESDN